VHPSRGLVFHAQPPARRAAARSAWLLAACLLWACSDGGADVADTGPEDQFGKPCTGPDDCESGWCVISSDGLVCTEPCVATCPEGWDCREVQQVSGDSDSICVNPEAALCQPCEEDGDCNPPGTGANACVAGGDAGSFCGMACDPEWIPCPDGYACLSVETAAGVTRMQCVPESDGCACNALGTQLGLHTACARENALGRCEGGRMCAPSGLTECSAPEPMEEICNGHDDDCNGQSDDGLEPWPCEVVNAHGSCPGVATCVEGRPACSAPEPQPEVCNGLDDDCDGIADEGFQDIDGDGVADCVDEDNDGDG
jgi:hypothetical protein